MEAPLGAGERVPAGLLSSCAFRLNDGDDDRRSACQRCSPEVIDAVSSTGSGAGSGRKDERMTDNGNSLGDGRLDDLLAALNGTPEQRLEFLTALFRELVTGARESEDEHERDRYATQALIVSTGLAAARNLVRVEELTAHFAARIDALAAEIHLHDDWARAEALAGNEWRQEEGDDGASS